MKGPPNLVVFRVNAVATVGNLWIGAEVAFETVLPFENFKVSDIVM